MAKKIKKRSSKKNEKIIFDKTLPQNILPIGERVEEDKNIYISQSVYKEIREFTKNKTKNESGGMLVGNVIEAFGKMNIVIHGFVEAKYSEGTPTTLKFTHETWDYVHEEIEARYEEAQIVGWIHTHPDFGIFLSEYDKFIQENFFKEENQIAYVVDPIQHIEGFYFWINGKIERCKGFYIFDKTGEKISIDEPTKEIQKKTGNTSSPILPYVLCGALVIITIVFALVNVNLRNRMSILESQQETLVNSANQSIGILQQQMSILNGQIVDLETQLEELRNVVIPQDNERVDENISDSNKDADIDMENGEASSGDSEKTFEAEEE